MNNTETNMVPVKTTLVTRRTFDGTWAVDAIMERADGSAMIVTDEWDLTAPPSGLPVVMCSFEYAHAVLGVNKVV